MIYFCPTCSSLCILCKRNGRMEIRCRMCPFQEIITATETYSFYFATKELDKFVFDEAEAWKNAAATDQVCPRCENKRAYYMQIQIRSGDEPMTTFYRCCNEQCRSTWKID